MAGPEWSDDPDTPQLSGNLAALYPRVVTHASSHAAPSSHLAKEWHRAMHEGVLPPSPAYIGRFRGDNHTDLLDYENNVGGIPGTRSYLVFGQVEGLVRWLGEQLQEIDALEATQLEIDMRVLEVAAEMHGEWVRIHPFVNGNGRTARLWILWLCARYGIRALLKVRPRPGKPYGTASYSSITGDHGPMATLLKQRYADLHSA